MTAWARSLRSGLGVVAVAIALATAGVAAHAADDASRVERLVAAVDAGDAATVESLLDEDTRRALVAQPRDLLTLLSHAHRSSAGAAPAGRGDEAAARVARIWVELARQCAARDPVAPQTPWIGGLAWIEAERRAPSESGEGWTAATAAFEGIDAAAGRAGDGRAAAYAVNAALEGAVAHAPSRHVLQKKADAITRKALARRPVDADAAHRIGATYLWFARALVTADSRRAKSALKIALDTLGPLVDETTDTAARTSLAELLNAAATLDRTAGFALKSRYRTVAHSVFGGALAFDVPESSRWVVTRPAATEADAETASADDDATYVSQTRADGSPRRQILFRSYDWTLTYDAGSRPAVKGDNVAGLLDGLCDQLGARVLAAGAKAGKSRKAHFGRGLTARSVVIDGRPADGTFTDPAPEHLRVHLFGVRGGHQRTFVVVVYDYDDPSAPSPELDAVLASFREPEE